MSAENELLAAVRPRAAEAVDFALLNGLLKYNAGGALAHAPFSLAPCPIEGAHHRSLQALTAPFNRLADAVSKDTAFLREGLAPTARVDEFTRFLLTSMGEQGRVQPLRLHLLRSDYFLHQLPQGETVVRQVELNTISASYAGLAARVNRVHRFLLRDSPAVVRLLDNDPLPAMAAGFAEAFARYGHPQARVMMVVQPGEANVFDQRLLELALREREIVVRRVTLDEVARDGALRDGHLVIRGEIAALTYFRAGYGPEDLATPPAREARQLIEASSTVAVPTLATQLAGSKRVQQLLCDDAILRRFCPPREAALLAGSFAGQFDLQQPLETPDGPRPAWQAAQERPEAYVLKPQREGGGHNLFEGALRRKLKGMAPGERQAYVLMERLRPASHPALLVRETQVTEAEAVSEIGRFGVYVAEGKRELLNRDAGYLVRTKGRDALEGGVSAGFGFLDSLILAAGE